MIPNIEIRLYLVDRYINGYKLNDPFYLKIKNILIKKKADITLTFTFTFAFTVRGYSHSFDDVT